MPKRKSAKRQAKRALLLEGGEHQASAKSAFAVNVGRSAAAARPLRSKTKAANRGKRGQGR
jgi:hypothetical protein